MVFADTKTGWYNKSQEMSDMNGQRFDAEFKKDIVKLYLTGARTCPSLAAELGSHENMVYKWDSTI